MGYRILFRCKLELDLLQGSEPTILWFKKRLDRLSLKFMELSLTCYLGNHGSYWVLLIIKPVLVFIRN